MRTARSNQPVIWRDVVDDLRGFKRYADEVSRWPRQVPLAEFGDFGSESPYRQMVRELAFAGHSPNDEDDPTRMGSAFHHWLAYNAPGPRGETPLQQLRRNLRKSAAGVLEQAYDDPEFIRLGGLKQSMKMYVDALNEAVEQAAPERLTYKGFKVLNPDRVWESNLVNVFDGIDYLVSLFKKRDVEPLLREGVKTIKVVEDAGYNAVGRYNSQSKQIIVEAGVTTAKMKMLDNFMHEVFVHEFGHHVHMTHMDASGRESWDAGWEFVDKAQADLNSKISVTPADRQRFFDLIERSGWSPQAAGRKVRGLDRLKYLMWLYKPMTNRIISTPNQVRLTDYGKAVFDFFRDPEASVAEFLEAGNSPDRVGRMLDRKTRMYKGTLGLTSDYAGVNHPMLDEASVEKVRAEDRSVDDALDALGIPTAYGRTNVKEDFAETFVLWMVHPERLSEQARNRMGRALWLSGFYGKPVMRVARRGNREMASYIAKRVAARWLAASRIKVNPDGTVVVYATTYTPDDPEQFVEDVEAILALPQRLTRKDYERLARKYGVKAHADSEMGDYGDRYGNYDFGHYFSNSTNRKKGWELTLKQRRWADIKASSPTSGRTASEAPVRPYTTRGRVKAMVTYPVGVGDVVEVVLGGNVVPMQVARVRSHEVTDDDPSFRGSHLLGWEGSFVQDVELSPVGVRTAKNLPKHVERYVQEGKDQGLDEGEAWAVAWSRYCKFRNPDSPHCKKDSPEDYLPNQGKKQAGGRPNADFEAEAGDIYPIGMDGSFSIPTTAFVSDLRGNEKKVRGVLEGHLKQTEQRDFRTMLQETGAKRLRFNFADSLIIGSGAEGMFGTMQWDDGIEVYFDGSASNEFMGAPPVFMVEGTFQPQ